MFSLLLLVLNSLLLGIYIFVHAYITQPKLQYFIPSLAIMVGLLGASVALLITGFMLFWRRRAEFRILLLPETTQKQKNEFMRLPFNTLLALGLVVAFGIDAHKVAVMQAQREQQIATYRQILSQRDDALDKLEEATELAGRKIAAAYGNWPREDQEEFCRRLSGDGRKSLRIIRSIILSRENSDLIYSDFAGVIRTVIGTDVLAKYGERLNDSERTELARLLQKEIERSRESTDRP